MRFYRESNKVFTAMKGWEGVGPPPRIAETHVSINAAKRKSRELQKQGAKFIRFDKLV